MNLIAMVTHDDTKEMKAGSKPVVPKVWHGDTVGSSEVEGSLWYPSEVEKKLNFNKIYSIHFLLFFFKYCNYSGAITCPYTA